MSVATADRCRIYRYYIVAQPVARAPLARKSSNTTIEIRRVEAGDPLVAQFPRPGDVIAKRFQMGAICIAAEQGGRFVGFIWLKGSEYPEDEVRCHYVMEPSTHAAWDFDVYIEPAFRFGRTFARLWDNAHTWLRDHDYQWTLSRISAFNPDSITAHRRLGTQTIGTATFACFGRVQVAVLGQAPFLHIARANAPALSLRPPNADKQ